MLSYLQNLDVYKSPGYPHPAFLSTITSSASMAESYSGRLLLLLFISLLTMAQCNGTSVMLMFSFYILSNRKWLGAHLAHHPPAPSTSPSSSFHGSFSSFGSQPPPLSTPLTTLPHAGPSTLSPRPPPMRVDEGGESEGSYMTDDASIEHSDSESEARVPHEEVRL